MKRASATAVLLLTGAVSACSLAPRYRVPAAAPAPPRYAAQGAWRRARPADTAPRGPWWRRFGDPTLDALENRVAGANQNVQAAYARLMQARAQTRIARAGLFPQLGAAAAASRSRTSRNSPRFPANAAADSNNFDVEGDLSYELDLWGRIRSGLSAARASQQASAADLATMALSMHAELAIDYFSLRSEDAQESLLDGTVEDYARALRLTQNLYRGGDAASTDVAQARAQLETARTAAADIRLRRAQTLHAIAVLVGANPSAFHLAANPRPLRSPPRIDPGLPSSLLERRPDIAAAERRVAAANAAIGVARAAYFPVFDLAAAAGLDSAQASNWLQASSRMWSLGASGVLSVFDAGLRRAQSAQAQARYDELVADYRNTVIGAYQEVEDDLAALAMLREESVSEAAAVAATAEAARQARFRYQDGAATYLEVAATQTAALQARQSEVSIETRRLAASVDLIEALGGDWRPRRPRAP